MNLSYHVLMNRNAPTSKTANDISDGSRQCLMYKWEKRFSSNKHKQRFSNWSYICDYVKVKNTRSFCQQLLHIIQNRQKSYTKDSLQLWGIINGVIKTIANNEAIKYLMSKLHIWWIKKLCIKNYMELDKNESVEFNIP